MTEKGIEWLYKVDNCKMRRRVVRNRAQFYNPKTGMFVKIDTKTGRILGAKKDGRPYKGIRRLKGSKRKTNRKNKRKRAS